MGELDQEYEVAWTPAMQAAAARAAQVRATPAPEKPKARTPHAIEQAFRENAQRIWWTVKDLAQYTGQTIEATNSALHAAVKKGRVARMYERTRGKRPAHSPQLYRWIPESDGNA